MNALTPWSPTEVGAAMTIADVTDGFALNSKAESTKTAYRSDWAAFSAWCSEHGLERLPASPETVARHLSACALRGLSVSTLSRKAAAVRYAHRLAGLESPCGAERVRTVLAGIRRTVGAAVTRKEPSAKVPAGDIRSMPGSIRW